MVCINYGKIVPVLFFFLALSGLMLGQVEAAESVALDESAVFSEKYEAEGDVTISGPDTEVRAKRGFSTEGKLTLESGATLQLDGGSSNMFPNETLRSFFNGHFGNGFELENGTTLMATDEGDDLFLSFGATSKIGANTSDPDALLAKLAGADIQLVGLDSEGKVGMQELENWGEISATGMLALSGIEMTVENRGSITSNILFLDNNSVLTLRNGDALNWEGDDAMLVIQDDSTLDATGQTLEFSDMVVSNANEDGGILANELVFLDGGVLMGTGLTKANTTFKDGSTAILTPVNDLNFSDSDVTFEDGSALQLTFQNGVGKIVTEGKITTSGTIKLILTNAFDGRAKEIELMQGGNDSDFGGEFALSSIFFKLTDTEIVEGDDSKSLMATVVKSANLVDFAGSTNQRGLSLMIDKYVFQGGASADQDLLFDGIMQSSSDSRFRHVIDNVAGVTRENAVVFALSSPWRPVLDNVALERLPLHVGHPSHLLDAATSPNSVVRGQNLHMKPTWKTGGQKNSSVSMPNLSYQHSYPTGHTGRALDLWFDPFYQFSRLKADGNAPGGEGHRGGFYGGFGLPAFWRESVLGVSVGYTTSRYKQWDDKTDISDLQIALYGGTNLFHRNLQLRAYIGGGFQDYDMERTVQLENYAPLPVAGDAEGSSVAAALYLLRPVDLSNNLLLKGLLGVDFEYLKQDGFTETGAAPAILQYDDVSLSRTLLRLGLLGDYDCGRNELYGRFLLGIKLAGDDHATSTHRFAHTADSNFNVDSVNLKGVAVDLGLGGKVALNDAKTRLLFVDYNTHFTSNTNSHAVSLGFLWNR